MSTMHQPSTEIKTDINKITTTIDRTFRRFDRENSWKICPACSEQWTKLRPCKIAGSYSYLCVECAESFKSWDWIVKTYPIESPFENWKSDWINTVAYYPPHMPRFIKVKDEVIPLIKNIRVNVNLWIGKSDNKDPHEKWILFTDALGIIINNKDGFVAHYDNALEAWFEISKKALDWSRNVQKATPTDDDFWNKPFKKTR